MPWGAGSSTITITIAITVAVTIELLHNRAEGALSIVAPENIVENETVLNGRISFVALQNARCIVYLSESSQVA